MVVRWLALVVGAVFAIVGAVLILSFPTMSFGWFAYAPRSLDAFTPAPQLSITAVAGVVLLISGFVLVAGWVGWRLARRRPPADR